MDIYWFILAVLAVWRVTHLLQAEDGPWDFVVRLRRMAGRGFWGRLLDCFHCLSLWVAAPPAWLLGHGWKEGIFLWLALSGGAILLEQLTRQESAALPAAYREDKENEHVMLWKSEGQGPSDQTQLPPIEPGS